MKPLNSKEGLVVTATELKQNLGKYLDFVEEQNDVVITKNGNKVARLTPYITDVEQYFTIREKTLDYHYGGKKVSYEEFMEINEKSTLRMEFIDGKIYLMESPAIRHQEVLGRLYLTFIDYFRNKKCKVLLTPVNVHFKKPDIKEPDVLQPDVLVDCDLENNITGEGCYMGTPTLIVEVLSDSTRNKDMIEKLNTYMLSGVKEYWIIDPKQENVMIYSFNNYAIDRYKLYARGNIAQSMAFQDLFADIEDLYKHLL